MFYATYNIYADLDRGNRGFANTWEVARFATREERDAFVAMESNRRARAVTRKEAVQIWRGAYLCVGRKPPRGGLFGPDGFGPFPFA
jgi:hypothetical protein